LGFWKWLPQLKEQSIKFTKDAIDYYVFIDTNYEGTFTLKPDLDKINLGNAWVSALKVIVEFNVDSKTKEAIDRHDPPAELISKIAPFYCTLEDSIRDIIRNDLGQYWVPHPYHHPEESEREIFGGLHFYNPTTKKMEQFLYGATVRLECPIPDEQILIDEMKWKKIETLIDENYLRFVDESFDILNLKNTKPIFVPISVRMTGNEQDKLIEHYVKKEYFNYWFDFEGKTITTAQLGRLRHFNNKIKEMGFFDKTISYYTNINKIISEIPAEENNPASDVLASVTGANIIGVNRKPQRNIITPPGKPKYVYIPKPPEHRFRIFNKDSYYYIKSKDRIH